MKFDDYNISPEIKTNLEKYGFRRPTDIQYKSIPPVLKGEDVLAIAQTGTGKTAAFAIPVVDILNRRKKGISKGGIRCIVMVPTHELARQINEVFQQICYKTRVNAFCIHGGVEQEPQIARLKKGVDVLIATPGRMFDLVSQGHLELKNIEILILDEADHMLDLGFIHDIRQLITFLPKKRQTLFFSATINEKIKKLAYSLVNNPIRIQISPKNPVARNVDHSVMFVEMDDKRFFLERLINEHFDKKILVFVRTKVRAERVCKAMERAGLESMTIHGDKAHNDRSEVMKRFKSGDIKVLIATDISARGIDIPGVDYVVNYDLPEKSENYVHRVGRTGRATQKGYAVSFCSSEERGTLSEIEDFLGKQIEVLEVGKADYHETLNMTGDVDYNWKALMKEAENNEKKYKKKKRKK